MESREIDENIPVACQVGAIAREDRQRWLEIGQKFYACVEEIVELPDGYALRFSPDRLDLVGEYVMRDRKCCAFVRWEIVVEQANGPAWLKIRGPQGTKGFVAAAIERTDLVPLEVAERAGFALGPRENVAWDAVAALASDLRRQ